MCAKNIIFDTLSFIRWQNISLLLLLLLVITCNNLTFPILLSLFRLLKLKYSPIARDNNLKRIQSIVINLGRGSIDYGFAYVTAQIINTDNSISAQFIGSLPPIPKIKASYQVWQATYQALSQRLVMLSSPEEEYDDELEIDEGEITQVSQFSFEEICSDLTGEFNSWLQYRNFLQLERKLRSHLIPDSTIRIIIETEDELVKRLPWHSWSFLEDYPDAEIALSFPEYKQLPNQSVERKKVRILAILGNCQDIDVAAEQAVLSNLPDAETKFLIKPSRREFDRELWDTQGWDILFFAGHSRTEGVTGRIYINEEDYYNSLTIEQLAEALKTAIARGLKLAIFNSCDGLGLANGLEKLNLPQVIVMREPVPNLVAQQFFHYFLIGFAVEKLPLYLAVKQARCRLKGLESEYPAASWLPVICQNPAVRSPNWLDLGGIPPCPYRGLFAFSEQDADFFFGREQCVSNLVNKVEQNHFVAIVGASGSGKSSIVFAGLVPQLRRANQTNWQIITFRPGSNPQSAMATAFQQVGEKLSHRETALTELIEELVSNYLLNYRSERNTNETAYQTVALENQGTVTVSKPSEKTKLSQRLLLIVDQFEEFYTLAPEIERQACLQSLIHAVNHAPAFTLLITLRADFYGQALAYRPLSDLLQHGVYNLTAMSRQELKNAIALPASKMSISLEKGLTDKLIDSVNQQSGRLPLLEFTLTQLWSQQQNGWLTHQAYNEIGGVECALANHAETVYSQLDRLSRAKMPKILTQLVQLAEGNEITRRIATKDEVRPENWDLVTYLADARLVMTNRNPHNNQETVEIAHEALINNWGRLKQWLTADEDFRRWQQRLRRAIAAWDNSSCDQGALLRGKPLADAQYWLQQRAEDLSNRDRGFIEKSILLQQGEQFKEKRRRKLTLSSLVIGLVLAIFLSGIAGWQWQSSAVNEILAISKYAKLLCASARGFDGLLESLKAAEKIQQTALVKQNSEVQKSVLAALQETVYGVRERNRIVVGEGEVRSVSFSPDGQNLASGNSNSKLVIWHQNGSRQASIDTKQKSINQVAFSPTGEIIATAGADGTLKLWQPNGKLDKIINAHQGAMEGIDFNPDGAMLATVGADGTLKLWDRQGKLEKTIHADSGSLFAVTYSPEGEVIATGGADGTVKIWNLQGELQQTITGYQRAVVSISFSPDMNILAASSEDGTMKFWSKDGTLLHNMAQENVIHDIRFTPDGRTLISVGGDTTVKLWNSDYSLRNTFTGHTDGVLELALSPDGNLIASASADGTIKLWQLNSSLFKTLQLHDADVYAAAFSPDSRMIATASGDKTVKLWNTDGTLLHTLKGHTDVVHGIGFSPDGNLIVTGSWDKTVKLWKVDGTLLNTLKGHTDKVYMAAICPDGKTIASASSDKTIKLWQLDGSLIATLTGHQDVVHGVSFSADGKIIASASHDRTVKLWNRQGKLLKTLTGHSNWVHGLAFSPDSQIIASASHDQTVKLWNLNGELLDTIVGHRDKVLGVTFSHDGQTIASSSRDGSVKLWHLDGSLIGTLRGHGDWVHNISFSPDDLSLVSASYDNTATIWDLTDINNLDVLVKRGCNWAEDYIKNNRDLKNICQV